MVVSRESSTGRIGLIWSDPQDYYRQKIHEQRRPGKAIGRPGLQSQAADRILFVAEGYQLVNGVVREKIVMVGDLAGPAVAPGMPDLLLARSGPR